VENQTLGFSESIPKEILDAILTSCHNPLKSPKEIMEEKCYLVQTDDSLSVDSMIRVHIYNDEADCEVTGKLINIENCKIEEDAHLPQYQIKGEISVNIFNRLLEHLAKRFSDQKIMLSKGNHEYREPRSK
jgi:hypothetical protein